MLDFKQSEIILQNVRTGILRFSRDNEIKLVGKLIFLEITNPMEKKYFKTCVSARLMFYVMVFTMDHSNRSTKFHFYQCGGKKNNNNVISSLSKINSQL